MKQLEHYINNYCEGLHLNKNSGQKYTCHPKDKDELRSIIKKRLEKDENADLNDIDVSEITNMYKLFVGLDPHKIDISEWDVSNVTNMQYMFFCCKNINCDLSKWNISNVKYMSEMFYGCENFNADLNKWNVSNVKDMHNMFYRCKSLKNKPNWYKE